MLGSAGRAPPLEQTVGWYIATDVNPQLSAKLSVLRCGSAPNLMVATAVSTMST